MKVLVTGVKGQLGYDVVKKLNNEGYNVLGIDIEDLDITDKEAVITYLSNYKPNLVIHCAAYTQVDKAELNEDMCHKVNALGTKYLAEACKMIDASMLYISTDYVFDGSKDGYYEVDDKTCPISVYGKTKLEGEEYVKSLLDKYYIIRISWAYGVNGNNFIKTMLRLCETRNELNVVCDQVGSPTYTADLAILISDMIKTNKYGIYHATNEGVCSWYEFASKIFELAGKDIKVNPVTTKEYLAMVTQQAKRPMNSKMSKLSLDKAGFNRLPSWKNALERYLKELI